MTPKPLCERLTRLTDEQRMREILHLVRHAKRAATEGDEGNWAECYYDDVRFLLALLQSGWRRQRRRDDRETDSGVEMRDRP